MVGVLKTRRENQEEILNTICFLEIFFVESRKDHIERIFSFKQTFRKSGNEMSTCINLVVNIFICLSR